MKLPKLNIGDLVWVLWRDHCSRRGWSDPRRVITPTFCESVGWVTRAEENSFSICQSFTEIDERLEKDFLDCNEVGENFCIIASAIEELQVIERWVA